MPEDKKHFDVAQPGQIPVSHTSRPVIPARQQTISADPMMRTDEPGDKSPMGEHKQPTLQPIHGDTEPEAEAKIETESQPSVNDDEKPLKSADTTTDNQPTASDNPAVQKLIDDKTYRLPIKAHASTTTKFVIVIIAALLLLGVGFAYFAMNR